MKKLKIDSCVELKTMNYFGYCSLCCSRCGTINELNQNGRLVKVKPNPEHPTGSAMCAKGRAAPELVYSDDRILYPLKRTNPKSSTNPEWVKISWEEALETVSEMLTKIKVNHGAKTFSFSISSPSATPISDDLDWISRFVYAYGSPNICTATEICNWYRDNLFSKVFGSTLPMPDYANSELIILWGHNPSNTWLSLAGELEKGRAKGAKTLVIDPRAIPLAVASDCHLQLKPGTDLVLALGIINSLIQNNLYNQRFISAWTNAVFLVRSDNGELLRQRDISAAIDSDVNNYVVWDFKQNTYAYYDNTQDYTDIAINRFALFGEYSIPTLNGIVKCKTVFETLKSELEKYTLEYVAEITTVPVTQIVSAINLLSSNKKTAMYFWSGLSQNVDASTTGHALAILYAMIGDFDSFGGNVIFEQCATNPIVNNLIDFSNNLANQIRPLGPSALGKVNSIELYDAILDGTPYKVRGLMSFGSNMLLTRADPRKGIRALQELEYYIACDLFHNPSNQYADIILPLNTPWERDGLRVGFDITQEAASHIQFRQKLISSRGESKSEAEIVFELAKRLNLEDNILQSPVAKRFNYILEPTSLTVEELKLHPEGIRLNLVTKYQKYRQQHLGMVEGFNTNSKRVELYLEEFLKAGYDALPKAPKSQIIKYPLIMTTYKSGFFIHSQMRQLSSLRKKQLFPVIEISNILAQKRDIYDGDFIEVFNDNAVLRFKAKINDTLHESTIIGEFGWWQSCLDINQEGYPVIGQASCNYNLLVYPDVIDEITGASANKAIQCDIRKVTDIKNWKDFTEFTLIKKETNTSEVNVLTFKRLHQGNEKLPGYKVGNHIMLKLKINNSEVVRCYSLIGKAGDQVAEYQIGVKKSGVMSTYLCSQLSVGDSIDISVPRGNFSIPLTSNVSYPIVIIAGGIGITPFLSYFRTLVSTDFCPQILFYYLNKDQDSHAFRDELLELAPKIKNMTVIDYYSDLGAAEQSHLNQRFSVDQIPLEILENARFYLCCSETLIDKFKHDLINKGIAEFRIFYEIFNTTYHKQEVDPNARFNIFFKRSNINYLWKGEDSYSILESGIRNNIKMPSGCRVGQCGSCVVNVLQGEVLHLIPVDIEKNQCLGCKSIPLSDLILDI